jgi:hypothetical protein
MLRDNWAGLIEPMRGSARAKPSRAVHRIEKSSDDRPQDALKIPAPKGRNLTLTKNAASPLHAVPRHYYIPPALCMDRIENFYLLSSFNRKPPNT